MVFVFADFRRLWRRLESHGQFFNVFMWIESVSNEIECRIYCFSVLGDSVHLVWFIFKVWSKVFDYLGGLLAF